MPTYEYLCKKCGHTFEELQSMSERPLTHCPKCGTESLARVMGGGGGFILKGSGFYGTDYRKHQGGGGDPGKKEAGKEESGNKPAGEGEKKGTEETGTVKKETERKDPEKKRKGKKETEKNDGGKGSPGSQPSPPPAPPEKKD